MFGAGVDLAIPTRVFEGQSDPNLTRVDIVFEARSDPHGHRVLLVGRAIPTTFSILGEWRIFVYILFLVRVIPSSVEHLTNFQLNLDDVLIA